MNGRPETSDIGFQPESTRLTDEALDKQAHEINPGEPGCR